MVYEFPIPDGIILRFRIKDYKRPNGKYTTHSQKSWCSRKILPIIKEIENAIKHLSNSRRKV